jgi:hypothetical protein
MRNKDKPRHKSYEPKYLKCLDCEKVVEVGQTCTSVICEDCTAIKFTGTYIPKTMSEYYKIEELNAMKGGNENMVEKKIVAKKVATAKTTAPKEKAVKAEKVDKKPKFGPEVEAKVIKLFKEGKKFTEISKEMGGSPAVPKIKRIIAAAGLDKK